MAADGGESTGVMADGGGLSMGEQVLAELLQAAHLTSPDRLADLLAAHAARLGVCHVTVYLADLQYVTLVPLPGAGAGDPQVLRIDGTLAGRVFRTLTAVSVRDADGGHRVLLPLVDGSVRLGVLELTLASSTGEPGEVLLARCRLLAQITGLLIISKSHYSDAFARLRHREPMALPAELEWALMPPQTVATDRVVVAAALEPAYRVGGDAYDFALIDDDLHLSLYDAAGHDLTAGLIAAITMAVARNTRRSGGHLIDIALQADRTIIQQDLEERFITAILGVLNLVTGKLEWVNCGHPPPLLIRHHRIVKELAYPADPPIGLLHGAEPAVHTEDLQPGDRLLLYTDGVIEARAGDGDRFGLHRLADTVIRTTSDGIPAPEAVRRLVHGLLTEYGEQLADDATVMLIEWRPEDPGALVTHGTSLGSNR
jgi:serine phosphatase RsbU (regulator of sigma subunit)